MANNIVFDRKQDDDEVDTALITIPWYFSTEKTGGLKRLRLNHEMSLDLCFQADCKK